MIKLVTDADLSQLFKTDPNKGLELLMDTYIGLVYTIVHSKLYTLYSKEDIEELVDSILELGEPDSEIFIRKYFFEQRAKEIAKIVHLKEGTIHTKVSRGLAKLKNLLGGEQQWRTKSLQ